MEPAQKKQKSNSTYNSNWEDLYGVCEIRKDMVMWILCKSSFTCYRAFSFSRHLSTKHPNFNSEYSFNSEARKEKLSSLKSIHLLNSLDSETDIHIDSVTASKISFEIAYSLVKDSDPFENSLKHRNSMKILVNNIFKGSDLENTCNDFVDHIPLSRRTITRRVESISENLSVQLKKDLRQCNYFSMQLDESTDVVDTAQLLIFVRMIFNDLSIKEELLSIVSLHVRTTSEEIFNNIKIHLETKSVPIYKTISTTADGARNITGKNKGLFVLLKQLPGLSNFNKFHWIIHQQALCMKSLSIPEVESAVVKIVNSIKSRSTQHRLFELFTEKNDSGFRDLKYYTKVRWLSRGIMVERFFENIKNIDAFLIEFEEQCLDLRDFNFLVKLAFLVDLINCVNEFNLQLQGQEKTYLKKINEESNGAINYKNICNYLNTLIHSFDERFKGFENVNNICKYLFAPFDPALNLRNLEYNIRNFWPDVKWPELATEIMNLSTNKRLKGVLICGGDIWYVITNERTYPLLLNLHQRIDSCFGSTYLCESTFSMMKHTKSKSRNRLTDDHLENVMRISTSSYKPDLEYLTQKLEK